MPDYHDYRSLLSDGHRSWHSGAEVIQYDYIAATPPSYYRSSTGWTVAGYAFDSFANLALDARERAMMEDAIARWNEVANVNLLRGGGTHADIVIGSGDFGRGVFGFAYSPDADALGRYAGRSGDIWLNSGYDQQYVPGLGPIQGHTSWYTYLHELGHALGLGHPNGDPQDPGSTAQQTVMSYRDHPSQYQEAPASAAFPLTPMVWDIQALQALYGAKTETRQGATVYLGDGGGWDSRAERAFQYGDTGLQLRGADGRVRDVILTLWDGGGSDLLDASDFSQDAYIDLRPGQYSSLAGGTDNIAVAAAVRDAGRVVNFIEAAWGGSGDDLIRGNGASNALRGGGGNDLLQGLGGADKLQGGAGNDTLLGHRGADMLRGQQGNDRLAGQSGDDHLYGQRGRDRLQGHAGDDVLFGGGRRDTLNGGAGQDTLDGGAGNDRLLGRSGADVFVFSAGTDRVVDFAPQDGDQIRLSGRDIRDFDDLQQNNLHQDADGVWIEVGPDRMLILGQDLSDMTADVFLL